MAYNTGDTSIVHLQVGDQVFITTMGVLNTSPVLAAKFSQRWNPYAASISTDNAASGEESKPQKLFLDADPDSFRYILDFLRHNQTPLIWDAKQGFDMIKYASVYHMACYYGLNDLARWIRDQKYKKAVRHGLSYQCLDPKDLGASQVELYNSDSDHIEINVVKTKGPDWACPGARYDHKKPSDCKVSCYEKDRHLTPEMHSKILERETARVLIIRSHSILKTDLLDA